MQRTAAASSTPARFAHGVTSAWHARRWYVSHTRRAYSVRPISPGDRRLLAEFALGLSRAATERELLAVHELTDMLFERVISAGVQNAVGFAALESTVAGDRVIGVCAYSPAPRGPGAEFCIAVAQGCREEQIGRTLLATLVRQAKRSGIGQLCGEMHWSNRAMQALAMSMGFAIEPVARDRNRRRVVLALR
ncbi:MAG TPA: GNAT family N-acetyltransferase [Steroidobacteraceae bacterium]|jgi:N-acetylglutamate synthase-like GNAT family acetyltransferase|nr:GNAT family N-acetyltransferase [Steroidobacteraceae bacterium]